MIRIGNKIIETTLKEGFYNGRIIGVQEGETADLKGGIKKDTIVYLFEFYLNGRTLEKKKTYISTKIKDSELMKMVTSILPELDVERDDINLEDLIGKECEIEIVIDYSKRGNRFENIGAVRRKSTDNDDTGEAGV